MMGHVEESAEEKDRRGDRHDHRDDVQDPQEQDVVPSGEALPHLVGAPEDGIDEVPFAHEMRNAEDKRDEEDQGSHREPEDGVFHHPLTSSPDSTSARRRSMRGVSGLSVGSPARRAASSGEPCTSSYSAR